MALTLASAGDTTYASVFNQIINALQCTSGQTEVGHYEIAGNAYTTTSLFVSCYLISRSRNATPVSISVDTADDAGNALNSPSTGRLTQGGALMFSSASSTNGNVHIGGNATFQY